MTKFSQLVGKVIREADILLFILDARRINESINLEVVYKTKQEGKHLIYVINKCDLLTKEQRKGILLPSWMKKDSIKISASKHVGTMQLLRKIMQLAKGKKVKVGVLGIPNTGKSTIINALKGRHSAPTSSVSGYTRSLRNVRVNSSVTLIDTPGVFSSAAEKNTSIIAIGALNPEKLDDIEGAAMDLIKDFDGKIQAFFGVEKTPDFAKTLEDIAQKKNLLVKGGRPDTARMAREIIMLCQRGKIR